MRFFAGIGAFLAGVRFVFATRRVWWRASVPALIALLITIALAASGIRFALPWAHHSLGEGVGEKVVALILVGSIVVGSVVVALALARPLSGWALEGIVVEQRRALGGDDLPVASASGLPSVRQSLVANLLALGVGIPALGGLAIVGWLFPPAAIATAPLDVVVAALLLAWDLLDYPLTGMPTRDRAQWCLGHFWGVLGFGLAASAFFAIPVVGWLALPFGVAGATRLAVSDRPRLPARAA